MRLFDAILRANHAAEAGQHSQGINLEKYAAELPIVAMTCIDPRLHQYFPKVMGIPPDSFIWLRNAGNIITDPLSSMTRSLALACAMLGGREIVIIGHTDCRVCTTGIPEIVKRFEKVGVDRDHLPENITEYFNVFSNERDNVIQSVELVRKSPLISPIVPVQGLLINVENGHLEWVVNGYDQLNRPTVPAIPTTTPGRPKTSDQKTFF